MERFNIVEDRTGKPRQVNYQDRFIQFKMKHHKKVNKKNKKDGKNIKEYKRHVRQSLVPACVELESCHGGERLWKSSQTKDIKVNIQEASRTL